MSAATEAAPEAAPAPARGGGLDAFLMKARDSELSPKARDLKRKIAKKVAAAASPSAA